MHIYFRISVHIRWRYSYKHWLSVITRTGSWGGKTTEWCVATDCVLLLFNIKLCFYQCISSPFPLHKIWCNQSLLHIVNLYFFPDYPAAQSLLFEDLKAKICMSFLSFICFLLIIWFHCLIRLYNCNCAVSNCNVYILWLSNNKLKKFLNCIQWWTFTYFFGFLYRLYRWHKSAFWWGWLWYVLFYVAVVY